jgi:Domain of unknown function (DUF4383)
MTKLRSSWTVAQWGLFVVCSLQLVWAVAGFIAEPSFSTADDAPTAQVLGVDFNGWHALSGLLLFGPGLLLALQPTWALLYSVYAGVLLVVTGIWALFSTEVALVLTFPNNESDAVLHLATGGVLLAIAAVSRRTYRAFPGPAAGRASRSRSARTLPASPPRR